MNLHRGILSIIAGALALRSAAAAEMAVSESFEAFAPEPGRSVPIPNGHNNLNWPGFEVFDGTSFPEGSQFRAGIVSGKNAAHVRAQGRITSEQPFTVRSFWLTGEANVPSIFTLWRGETRMWFSRVVPADGRPQRVSFAEFEDVTRMEIQAYGQGIVLDEMELAIQPPTETITFDDISATTVTNGYWRLRWDGFEAVDEC